jgi:hypothetical protein
MHPQVNEYSAGLASVRRQQVGYAILDGIGNPAVRAVERPGDDLDVLFHGITELEPVLADRAGQDFQ